MLAVYVYGYVKIIKIFLLLVVCMMCMGAHATAHMQVRVQPCRVTSLTLFWFLRSNLSL